MKLAIIGLPQSGKSTVFNALTGSEVAPSMSGGRVEVHKAVVDVPDARLQQLAELYASKKIVHAQITFADVAGMGSGEEGLPGQFLNALAGMDGLLIVLRAFEDPSVPHARGGVDPARDLAALKDELLLNDLIAVERKLERLAEERQKSGRDIAAVEREQAFFSRLQNGLNDGAPLRQQQIVGNEAEWLGGLGLLTQRPLLVVLNMGEGQELPAIDAGNLPVLTLQGKLEMDLAQLSEGEQQEFLSEYGLEELGAQRVIRSAYDLLAIQTFYTVAEPEAHAWMLARGASALEAAGTVHSDIARGFIRAEVVGAKDLIELGGMAKVRESGRFRLEGKDYVMQDGDVINVRFNV